MLAWLPRHSRYPPSCSLSACMPPTALPMPSLAAFSMTLFACLLSQVCLPHLTHALAPLSSARTQGTHARKLFLLATAAAAAYHLRKHIRAFCNIFCCLGTIVPTTCTPLSSLACTPLSSRLHTAVLSLHTPLSSRFCTAALSLAYRCPLSLAYRCPLACTPLSSRLDLLPLRASTRLSASSPSGSQALWYCAYPVLLI
jgi:hypothetical protein